MPDTKRLRELLSKATPLPWVWDDREDQIVAVDRVSRFDHVASGIPVGYENTGVAISEEDRDLVIAAVNELPGLLDAVDPTPAAIRALFDALPDETARVEALREVMRDRCPRCFEHDPNGQFWCCYDSRGD